MEIDELTIAGARRGDMRACEKIYRKFHTQAFTLAARICNNRELARDVTQEAFISAFKRMHQYRGDAPFWAWLRRVVVNHAVSFQLLRECGRKFLPHCCKRGKG